MTADDLWDFLFKNSPETPYATGAYARGFVYMLNEDGSVDTERCKEYYAAKAVYDAKFENWKSYWVAMGRATRGEEGEPQ